MRLDKAVAERETAAELGCTVVINDDLERTVAELTDLIEAARA